MLPSEGIVVFAPILTPITLKQGMDQFNLVF